MTPILFANQLTKRYGDFTALDSFTLSLNSGEVFGLLGPNGSGKSTAIRMMLGFIQPSSGTVSISGFDGWSESVEVRKRVAYLPGELRLYENYTGRQLLNFLLNLRQVSPKRDMDQIAKSFDIDLDRKMTQMSSGMKRKVALISVLLPDVPLIILDEPTNTLDPTMRDQLLKEIKNASREGQTVLFSSHVLSEVEAVCDRICILRKGVLVHEERLDEVKRLPLVRAKFNEVPKADWQGKPFPWTPNQEGWFEWSYDGAMPELLTWLSNQHPLDCQIIPSGLEPTYQRFHGDVA
jgi:ABC-2 type transport system ATP-binding protein